MRPDGAEEEEEQETFRYKSSLGMHDGVDDARNGRVAGPDLFCMSVIE